MPRHGTRSVVDFVRLVRHAARARAGGVRVADRAAVFVGDADRPARTAARAGCVDRGICSRASLKRSANSSSASRRAAASACASRRRCAGELSPGDSLAVNGVCLTVILRDGRARFTPISARRPCACTTLGIAGAGQPASNLERPLRADSRFGGHFVQGHVDAIGHVEELRRDAGLSLADGQLSVAAGAVHRPQGLDRDRRHQPDGRRARRRPVRRHDRARSRWSTRTSGASQVRRSRQPRM